jgi:hypothetical protein
VKWSYNVTGQKGSGQPLSGVTIAAVSTGGGTETVKPKVPTPPEMRNSFSVCGRSASSPTTVNYAAHTVTVTAASKVRGSRLQTTLHQTTSQTIVCE